MIPVARSLSTILAAAACLAFAVSAADAPIEITVGTARTIPILLSGYSPDIEKILAYDLSVVGFEIVSGKGGQYQLTGASGGTVQGTLVDAVGAQKFSRTYPGGSPRSQAHALSDDVVKAVLGLPGIARTKIAFRRGTGARSSRGDWVSEIAVSDFDGANATLVTEDGSVAEAPTWAPHRLFLYYTSYRSRFPDIYAQDLGTGSRTVFAQYPGLNTSAAVSPDCSKVAMILSKSGRPNLWVADVGGGNLRQVTTSKEMEASPCWSPDGQSLCFTSTAEGRAALYTVPASGGAMKRLKTGGIRNCTEPDWSPDGKWIAFTRASGEFTLYVVPAAGGDPIELVPGEDPSWAPNSRTLIFTRGQDHNRRLSLLDVPTRRVKDIPGTAGTCSQPSWSR
jgi:TolB protein